MLKLYFIILILDCFWCLNCPAYSIPSITEYTCICDRGAYGIDGRIECAPCPAGTYQPNSGQDHCIKCPLGTFSPNIMEIIGCIQCPAGTYNEKLGAPSYTDCIPCNPGTSSNVKAATSVFTCKKCSPGYYSREFGSTKCIPCEAGTFDDREGASSCIGRCPSGTSGFATGQTTGNYCAPCPEATYASDGIGGCIRCPAGTFSNVKGASSISSCTPCPAGSYSNEGSTECKLCPCGTYSTPPQTAQCTECPIGTSSSSKGSTSSSACSDCSPGTYCNRKGCCECSSCAPGNYTDTYGTVECSQCRIGTYNHRVGKTSANCLNCAPGTYGNVVGLPLCFNCPEGTYNPNTGSITLDDCIKCTSYVEATGSFSPCPKGTYNNGTGQISAQFCSYSPGGSYKLGGSQDECRPCPPGHYQSVVGSTSCKPCPTGSYTYDFGTKQCTECDPGSFIGSTGTIEPYCFRCGYATYNPYIGAASCIKCPPGSYGTYTGATDDSNCLLCPAGTYAQYPTDKCTLCHPGTYNNLQRQEHCFDCPAGTFGAEEGLTSVNGCQKCEPGYASVQGSASCSVCPPGTYKDEQTPEVCVDCGDGTFSAVSGASSCTDCYPLCKKCTSAKNNKCSVCWEHLSHVKFLDETICMCEDGYYLDYLYKSCRKCHIYCTLCDTAYDDCLSCIENPGILRVDSKCLCSVKGFFDYTNSQGILECVQCHPLCELCYGPYSDQCTVCASDKHAILISPETCVCQDGYFYSTSRRSCEACNRLCKTCFGESAEECYSCNMDEGLMVKDKENICVEDCYSLGNYYRDENTCKLCDKMCATCIGPKDYECTSCNSIDRVMYEGECIPECQSHYFAKDGICYKCNDICLECSTGSRYSCTKCYPRQYFYKGTCIDVCPEGTYPNDNNMECVTSVDPCTKSISNTRCLECIPSLYLIPEEYSCVDGIDCPPGTYPNLETKLCEVCNPSCLTCIGPLSSDCTSCDEGKGYMKLTAAYGTCTIVACSEGYYLDAETANCLACHFSCKSCDSPKFCIECKTGMLAHASEVKNRVLCEGCPEGYQQASNGQCKEICRDGMNLGTYECDDGNNINGDGCSSECKIEAGYRCYRQNRGRDICKDIAFPYATLRVVKGNELEIIFSERMISIVSSDVLRDNIIVTLEGLLSDPIVVSWNLTDEFKAYKVFNQFTISTKIKYTLRGNVERFYVVFLQPDLLQDLGGNPLTTSVLSAPSLRQLYLSPQIESFGSVFSSSTLVTFIISIGLNPVKSCASFWIFINMLQLISLIPAIDCVIPGNLELFITKYFGISKASIPFDSLPSWIPNPLVILNSFKTDPINERLDKLGYTSLNFVYNFSSQMWTWFTVALTYLGLSLGVRILPSSLAKPIEKVKKGYEYNNLIRIIIMNYLSMVFCATLNVWFFKVKTIPIVISFSLSVFFLFFALAFIFYCFALVEVPNSVMRKTTYREKFGILTEGIKSKRLLIVKAYYPLYLIRLLLYVLIITTFEKYPMLQLILITSLTLIPVLMLLMIDAVILYDLQTI